MYVTMFLQTLRLHRPEAALSFPLIKTLKGASLAPLWIYMVRCLTPYWWLALWLWGMNRLWSLLFCLSHIYDIVGELKYHSGLGLQWIGITYHHNIIMKFHYLQCHIHEFLYILVLDLVVIYSDIFCWSYMLVALNILISKLDKFFLLIERLILGEAF